MIVTELVSCIMQVPSSSSHIARCFKAIDMSVSLLGEKVAFPVGVAPMGTQRLAHDDGEVATARGTEVNLCNFIL